MGLKLKYWYFVRRLSFRQLSHRALRVVRKKLYSWFGKHLFPVPEALSFALSGVVPLGRSRDLESYYSNNPEEAESRILEADRCLARQPLLLNCRVDVGRPLGWDLRSASDQLAVYSFHYLEWTVPLIDAYLISGDSKYLEEWFSIMEEWVQATPLGHGEGWDPYPISRRLILLEEVFGLFHGDPEFTRRVDEVLLASVHQQAQVLVLNPEHDLGNNHLIANGRALAGIGALFDWPQAEQWKEVGNDLLWKELDHQAEADGIHCERSTSYQTAVIKDGLEGLILADVDGLPVPDEARKCLERMVECLAALSKPNRQLPLLNDSVRDYPMDFGALLAVAAVVFKRADFKMLSKPGRYLAAKLGTKGEDEWQSLPSSAPRFGSVCYRKGGYAVMRSGWSENDSVLVFDGGPMGPAWNLGHGHSDALSFELCAAGMDRVVDAGTYTYHSWPWRGYFRGTRAHNTLVVDGKDQSELWGSFRVGQAAQCAMLDWSSDAQGCAVSAEHDGYRRLESPVVHRRRIRFFQPDRWTIEDSVRGQGEHTYEILFHFPAEASAGLDDQLVCRVEYAESPLCLVITPSAPPGTGASIERGWVSQTWNLKEEAPVLCYSLRGHPPLKWVFELKTVDC